MTGHPRSPCSEADGHGEPGRPSSPGEALRCLKDGNAKFVASSCLTIPVDRTPDPGCRKKQKPIAVIVGCSDSRVPPELVFSQGLGDLFVIRSAGNTIDPAAMGSLEYAVHRLETPLVVVMGHECCGAVSAAYDAWRCGTDYPGSMSAFVEPILPAVIDADKAGAANVEDASIKANVARIVKRLRENSEPLLLDSIKKGKLRIVGARYNFDGQVDFFDEGPVVPPPPLTASVERPVA